MDKIIDLFYEKATLYPDKIAIWCDNETITYRNLAYLVSQYSRFLLENGVSYRDHIGIPMNNSINSAALILAAANLGVGLVPINPTLPFSGIQTAFASADVKHVVARRVFLEQCNKNGGLPIKGASICIDEEYQGLPALPSAVALSTERPIIQDVDGSENFIITMTSGSTGTPKPICLTQNNKYTRATAHIRLYGLTENDRILAATPLYHSLAERLVLMPLMLGATAVILPRFTPVLWLNCVKEQKVTFTIAVSAQLGQVAKLLTDQQTQEIDSLRSVVSSSSLLEPQVKTRLIDTLRCDFHEMYGASEVSTVTSIDFKEAFDKKQSVGKPLSEAEVMILDEDGHSCPSGVIGEIACKTTLECEGYYGMEEAFEASKQNGFFKTGDLGYLDEDGYLYFSGRKKDLIITGGINVYPQDIEKCVMEMAGIRECAAFAYPDERLGEVVGLAVVTEAGSEPDKRAVQVQCARNLADFQQPHHIFFMPELPKNPMGKLVRSTLMEDIKVKANFHRLEISEGEYKQ